MKKADFGMIGLAVMGANFSRNVARNGFCVSAYDVTPELSARFSTLRYIIHWKHLSIDSHGRAK